MSSETKAKDVVQELTDEDEEHIRTIFHDEVTAKLAKLDARLGNVNCGFAGEQYRNWTIEFRSVGDDFQIVDFEFDEEGEVLDLDL